MLFTFYDVGCFDINKKFKKEDWKKTVWMPFASSCLVQPSAVKLIINHVKNFADLRDGIK